MSMLYSYRHVLRATIEFTTPFLIGAGEGGEIADAVFVADANGLPAIPGSSLAGVLRAAFRVSCADVKQEERIFGFQHGDEGAGSLLRVSWACIHDENNRPVEGIVLPECLDDAVLARAFNTEIRDHVRINSRGVSASESNAKFDEQALCAGHRFTFELELIGDEQSGKDWASLLALLRDPALRLGGKTRRGFGAFKVIALHQRSFDLRQDFHDYCNHPVRLAESSPVLPAVDVAAMPAQQATVSVTLQLRPHGYWMIGGGYDLADAAGEADMAPVRDCRISWDGNRGTVVDDLLYIPATSLKGALAHRVAFHYNALTGIFADQGYGEASTGEGNTAVRALFGYCKGGPGSDGADVGDGQRGRILIDDCYLAAEPKAQLVHHVGIDRYTGGARDKVLFCERPLWQGNTMQLRLHICDAKSLEAKIKIALTRALHDLVSGRLQVGAGHGRGLGYFSGSMSWSGEGWSIPAENPGGERNAN